MGRRAQEARLPDVLGEPGRRAALVATAPLLGTVVLAAAGFAWHLPPGFPPPRVSADNPMTAEKVALGRRLFFDARLSGNGTQSCASCHRPEKAFTDGRTHALGSTGEEHPRSAMSLANAAYAASLTWADPGKTRLEDQMLVPMLGEHPVEMGLKGHEAEALERLRAEPLYAPLFAAAFPGEARPFTLDNVRKAIACFERTLLSGNSPYDRRVWQDDRTAMSPAAWRGMALFFSEPLHCSSCHGGFTFSGPSVWSGSADVAPTFHDNGLPHGSDAGLAAASHRVEDAGRFRAPTLRNIAVTAPYMHDGRFATLGDVLDHYARNGPPKPGGEAAARGFSLSAEEKSDVIAFLESLTDEVFLKDPGHADPWKDAR